MPPDPCPPTDELEALLLGRLPPARAAALHRHMAACSACPVRAAMLPLESRLLRALQELPPVDQGPPSTLLSLMSSLERLVPVPAPETVDDFVTDAPEGFLTPPQGADEVGRLGAYIVREQLGRGGMGIVFRADDTRLARPVALKVLRPRAARAPGATERFLREARAMAAVRHDHIAVIHEVGVASGAGGAAVPFLAMELLEGEMLHDRLRRGPRAAPAWAARVGREAALGLAAAHAAGLIHRDVKPSNLWLEPTDGGGARVKLIDFGMAAPLDGAPDGVAGGTPAYMAPEQFAGAAADARSDLFGLGCVLYELVAGEHPFPGRTLAPSPGGDPPPAPARDLNPDVGPRFSDLISRMLADDPSVRPASARAAAQELAAAEQEASAPRRRTRWPMVAAGFAGALAVALVGVHTPAPPEAPQPPADAAVDRPPFPAGPPDDWWCRRVAELPANEQFRVVNAKLAELNPGYNAARATGWVEREDVIRFTPVSDFVRDIRPVRGLPGVRTVRVAGTAPGRGAFTDLSPLTGLRLFAVRVENNPELRDLSPVAGTKLTILDVSHTAVDTLRGLDGSLLEELYMAGARVADLAPVRAMPRLRRLDVTGCPVTSLEPLAGTPVEELKADVRTPADAKVLRRMPRLKLLNGAPARGPRAAPPTAPR